MEHLGHPSPHFNDAKMARFCSFAPSSLLWGGWGIIVPFYTVQDCRSPSGSFRCNKTSCTVCPFIEDGRNQYTFCSTGQTFKIKSHITCETSNVIYMIQCTKCNLQYIGETKRRLKDRFNEHRRPIINPFCSYTPTAVSRHFLTSGHAEDHMILIPLEQLYTSRDSIRKAREAFLIHRGKTLEPAGLNRRDEM